MLELIAALLLGASRREVPPAEFACRNQIEVWCEEGQCAARPAGEMTPMDIRASLKGDIAVCAYSGCWTGKARVSMADGRILWTAERLPFSTSDAPESAAGVTLLIVPSDGVGFVRAAGFATPLSCVAAEQRG